MIPQIPRQHIADIELPQEVHGLYELAYNLWWAWDQRARLLFAAIDPRAWNRYHNPVEVLINVEPRHWDELLQRETFLEDYASVVGAFERYMHGAETTWFRHHWPEYSGGPVAYLSMEFGLHQSLAIYSGGLGILSADHLKSASDLGLPFVALGLLYRSGYFRQTLDAAGQQQHYFPTYDFARLPVRPAASPTGSRVVVSVPFPDREVKAQVWVAQVGRVPLLLLDTDIAENDPADRPITNTLYVSGRPMRFAQELVLGVGGCRALATCGIDPAVYHINEGHSALLQLERMAGLVADGKSFAEASAAVRAATVFTTHTPVPAGNESFDSGLAAGYLEGWPERLGCTWPDIDALAASDGSGFNLTALALRTSRYANGVSALHGEVSRGMWRHLFGAASPSEVPIDHITNGVHVPTWIGREMLQLLQRHLGDDWQAALHRPDFAAKVEAIPDHDLWQAHQAQKNRLARFTRARLLEQLARHGRSPEELRRIEEVFRHDALTIGFARRFATYKRASLVFSDPHALRALFSDPSRPVQILFAGKAHPADRPGQELIQHIFQLSQNPPLQGRVFFLEDYDMLVARMMVQGVDVWLNTPRRPQEASGTSGQKAALNGALNCSVLDGWWPEAWAGTNGWAIGSTEEAAEPGLQDIADAQDLYRVLEDEAVPAYYDRDADDLPRRWLQLMKRSIATIAPAFSADRMVRDYALKAYRLNE